VPPETIRELATRYALAKPAAIYHNFGDRYYHGNLARRAQMALGSVCGYLGESGGGVFLGGMNAGWFIGFNLAAVTNPTDAAVNVLQLQEAMEAIATGKPFPIKMWINKYRNPIHCCPNPQRWIQEVVPNLDFIVNINIRMDWTAEYADILLPDATIFERVTLGAVQDHVVLSGPAIEPLFEARTAHWIWSELARRVDLGEYFRQSEEDFLRTMLESTDAALEGITLEKLQESGGMLRANSPETPYVALAHKQFDTPTGRIEFYSERLTSYGEELPVFKPGLEIPIRQGSKYPLQLQTPHTRFYMQTDFGDLPVLKQFVPEPWLEINPEDADTRAVSDGNTVEVFNDRGGKILKAVLSSAVPVGVVKTHHGPGRKMYQEGHYQMLTLPWGAKATSNPVHELRYQLTRPWWKWAGGQADIISDCAVDVRKAKV
jgi:molybdopterin-containing oxidoreductase family molybdopterin binding subunit